MIFNEAMKSWFNFNKKIITSRVEITFANVLVKNFYHHQRNTTEATVYTDDDISFTKTFVK